MQNFKIPANTPAYVGGSRSLVASSPAGRAVAQFSQAVTATNLLHVGCATGGDKIAIQNAHQTALKIFAQFAPSGQGAISSSATNTVKNAALCRVPVQFLAGGALSVPVRVRLIKRSIAAFSGCGVAVFFAPGAGSLSVARHALKAGIPVLVWQSNTSIHQKLYSPPIIGAKNAYGQNVRFLGLNFWLYEPKQKPLF